VINNVLPQKLHDTIAALFMNHETRIKNSKIIINTHKKSSE